MGAGAYRGDIQGLRGVAVLAVVAFHLCAEWLPGGFTGVDLFFVVSGYVIAGSVARDLAGGRFSIGDFYARRARRLLPALMVVLAATSAAAMALLLPEDLVGYARSLAATAAFGANIWFWRDGGYFAPDAQTEPLLHCWSLGIEEQFYLVAPVGLAAIARYGRRRWLAWLLPLALGSFAVSVAAAFLAPRAGFFLLPARAWELLAGMLVALAPARAAPRWLREAVAAAGMLAVGAGCVALSDADPFPGWWALLPCLGAAATIGAGPQTAVATLLGARPLRWFGDRSYALYLVHWPIVALVHYRLPGVLSAGLAAVVFAGSTALAALLWRFVEQPGRRLPLTRHRSLIATGAAAVGVMALAGTVAIASDGFPTRFPGYAHQAVAGVEDWGGERCFATDSSRPIAWDAARCTRIRGGGGRILLWGDSHAAHYVPGILAARRAIGADVLQRSFAGCPPILAYRSLARPGCGASNAAVPALIASQRIGTVVLAAAWGAVPRPTLEQLPRTIAALHRAGARVVVIGPSPQFGADVQRIDYLSGQRRLRVPTWPLAFPAGLQQAVAAAARGADRYLDPVARLCRRARCPYRIGDAWLYADAGHFSAAGARVAVRAYFPSRATP